MMVLMDTCEDCNGTRSVPDVVGDPGPCPSCVIDAGDTFVVFEDEGETVEG